MGLAGAAGGLGAIFRTPLGGAITAIEILYKEDFEKFMEGLNESIEIIKENAPPIVEREAFDRETAASNSEDVSFDDLGK